MKPVGIFKNRFQGYMTLNGRLTLITTKSKYALLRANVSVQINYGKIT